MTTMRIRKDITGERFGKLTVIGFAGRSSDGHHSSWLCRCDCGTEKRIAINNLGRTTFSCRGPACVSERGTKHGHTRGVNGHTVVTPTYETWRSMVQRCTNPNSNRYHRYGARGITICKRWMTFANFLADMGERPPDKTLDRKNNNKGYSKRNCRWATRLEQARNTSRSAA